MIVALMLFASPQAADTTDLHHVFRIAIGAAYDTMRVDSPRMALAPHVVLDHRSLARVTGDSTNWKPLIAALAYRGTTEILTDCADKRCPVISAETMTRTTTGIDITLIADYSIFRGGRVYLSLMMYRVHVIRRDGRMIVESVTRGWIT